MKISGSQRFDTSDSALTEQNPNALDLDTASGQVHPSKRWRPSCLDVASIPGNGARLAFPGQTGNAALAVRNGYIAADITPAFGAKSPELMGGCSGNAESAYGHVRVGYDLYNQSLKADFADETRGAVRELQLTTQDPTACELQKIRELKPGQARWIESWDYKSHTVQMWVRPSFALPLSPRFIYSCAEEASYRELMPFMQARQKLDAANGTGGNGLLQHIAGKQNVIFGTNVVQKITDVHKFSLGASLTKRGDQTFKLGFQVSVKNSFAGVQSLRARQYFTQAIKNNTETARIVFRCEDKDSWQQYAVACFGGRATRRATVANSHQEFYDYADTPDSLEHLKQAEESFYEQKMPEMHSAAALQKFETPLSIGPKHVRRSGSIRSQEAVAEFNLTLRLYALPIRPGYWTVMGREIKYTNRREFDVSHESGRPILIERVLDSRRVNDEKFGTQPTVRDITAAEEWLPAQGDTPAQFHGFRLCCEWYAKSPQSPEMLNSVINYYNCLFGISSPLLKTGPGALKATRRIKIDTSLSASDIQTLGQKLSETETVEKLRQQLKVPVDCVAQLQAAFAADPSLKNCTQALRLFIVHSGVRGMALIHRLADRTDAHLKIDADEEIFANASAHCAKILLRYQKPLDHTTDLADVENRLYDAANALRLVQHARGIIEQDAMLTSDKREANLAYLGQQEIYLRQLYDVDANGMLRNSLYQKLIDRWFMTLQDYEFAALFHRVSEVHRPLAKRIVDKTSAEAYLRHFDTMVQVLKKVETGTINNILLTQQQRVRHLEQIREAIANLEKDFIMRRTSSKKDKDRYYLLRPHQACGTFWFFTARGWRLFWLVYNGENLREQLNFWSRDTLLTMAS